MRVLGCLGKGPHGWLGVKPHMGFNQEAYDAECVAIVRALDLAAERQKQWGRLEKVAIFTDAQTAITRMQACEVGSEQHCALQARKALAKIKAPVERSDGAQHTKKSRAMNSRTDGQRSPLPSWTVTAKRRTKECPCQRPSPTSKLEAHQRE